MDALFDTWDPDGNGVIDHKELGRRLRQGQKAVLEASLRDGAAGEIVLKAKNRVGLREDVRARAGPYHEPSVPAIRAAMVKEMSRVKDLFVALDVDHDGSVSKEEMRLVLPLLNFDSESAAGRAAVDEIFDSIDVDRGGTVDFRELHTLLRTDEAAAQSGGAPLSSIRGTLHIP